MLRRISEAHIRLQHWMDGIRPKLHGNSVAAFSSCGHQPDTSRLLTREPSSWQVRRLLKDRSSLERPLPSHVRSYHCQSPATPELTAHRTLRLTSKVSGNTTNARRHPSSTDRASACSRHWRSTGLQRQTKTQLRVCTDGNRYKRGGFRKSWEINRPRQDARSRDCLTQGTFRTIMIRDGTLFRSFLPSPFSGLLVMMMTSPVFVTVTMRPC
jgi:hypothetical protein